MYRVLLPALVSAVLSLPISGFNPQPEKMPVVVKVAGGSYRGSYLGIGVSEVDHERMKALNLPEERGVEVTRVEEEGPAARAGIKVGDVILEYNRQSVEGTEQLLRIVRETPPGREVKLGISRNGSPQTVVVRTGSRKPMAAKLGEPTRIEIPTMEIPDLRMPEVPKAFMTWRSASIGVEAESLESQLAEFFGVKEGVLVRSVAKGSAAERAGLKAGDVITRVDNTQVASPKEITQVLRASRGRKEFPLRVVRDKRETTVTILIDEYPGRSP